jgi:hypothetical protein
MATLRRNAANHCRSDPDTQILVRKPHRDALSKETPMSAIPSLSSTPTTPSALSLVNTHPHGHKKGSHAGAVESTDDSNTDTTTHLPVAATQNLFGNLLRTLQRVIGLKLSAATPVTAPGAGTASTSAAAAFPTTAGTPQSASTLLQNYTNNLSQSLQANGSPVPKLVGSNVSVNA